MIEACLKATDQAWAEISATNSDFKKLIKMMIAFRNDDYVWWVVAEYSYDTFIIRSQLRG